MEHNSHIRNLRRRYVKRYGKKLVFGLDRFLARQSLIGDRPVFDAAHFPWVRDLESGWTSIRAEADELLRARDRIPAMHEVSPDQARISTGSNWRSFFLYGFGEKIEGNLRRCPDTARIVRGIPGLRTAFFSILAPGYHIRAHRGVTKSVIRCHLGLMVPSATDRCRIRIGSEICHWAPGKCLVFDDTYEHEVWNETEEERVVLIVDLDRPMRMPGRLAGGAALRALRWSAYVRDARKNIANWEARHENAAQRAEAYHLDTANRPDEAGDEDR